MDSAVRGILHRAWSSLSEDTPCSGPGLWVFLTLSTPDSCSRNLRWLWQHSCGTASVPRWWQICLHCKFSTNGGNYGLCLVGSQATNKHTEPGNPAVCDTWHLIRGVRHCTIPSGYAGSGSRDCANPVRSRCVLFARLPQKLCGDAHRCLSMLYLRHLPEQVPQNHSSAETMSQCGNSHVRQSISF
jgi:hypothetical protein